MSLLNEAFPHILHQVPNICTQPESKQTPAIWHFYLVYSTQYPFSALTLWPLSFSLPFPMIESIPPERCTGWHKNGPGHVKKCTRQRQSVIIKCDIFLKVMWPVQDFGYFCLTIQFHPRVEHPPSNFNWSTKWPQLCFSNLTLSLQTWTTPPPPKYQLQWSQLSSLSPSLQLNSLSQHHTQRVRVAILYTAGRGRSIRHKVYVVSKMCPLS